MRLHPPKTDYEKMMFNALSRKLVANHKHPKKSKRDEIREYNEHSYAVKLNVRSKPTPASLHSYVIYTDVSNGIYFERRPIDESILPG